MESAGAAGIKWKDGLAVGCPGEGKSSWRRLSLVNTRRPQECESSLGRTLTVKAQPTHDPPLAWKLCCQGWGGRETEERKHAL